MTVSEETKNKILLFVLKEFVKKTPVTLKEIKRSVGQIVHDGEFDRIEVAQVVGDLYKEVVNEVFDLKNFENEGH